MTSEVVLMNSGAVAMAADSAVTVSAGSNSKKIYNSANKLFALSKHEPIGVMIYNDASVTGVPVETIIKMYRADLGDKSFETVEKYRDDFIAYLNNGCKIFSEEDQEYWFISEASAHVCSFFEAAIDSYVIDGLNSYEDEFNSKINETFNDMEKLDFSLNIYSQFEEDMINENSAKLIDLFSNIYEHNLPEETKDKFIKKKVSVVDFDKIELDKLVRILVMVFTRETFYGGYTGIVFSGFGTKEIKPCVCSIVLGGIFKNKVKYEIKDVEKITSSSRAAIKPFAQSDMLNSLIGGASDKFLRSMYGMLFENAYVLSDSIIDSIDDLTDDQKIHWKKEVKPISVKSYKDTIRNIRIHSYNEHYYPVVSAIQFLPIDELAVVAETCVNLNSFQKKVSMEDETVGGPVDVLVISKGDGLIWIKRKHYFDPKYNHQFFTKYNNE